MNRGESWVSWVGSTPSTIQRRCASAFRHFVQFANTHTAAIEDTVVMQRRSSRRGKWQMEVRTFKSFGRWVPLKNHCEFAQMNVFAIYFELFSTLPFFPHVRNGVRTYTANRYSSEMSERERLENGKEKHRRNDNGRITSIEKQQNHIRSGEMREENKAT